MKGIESVYAPPALQPRAPDTHKGTYGRVLLLAGSSTMAGAAVLAARGALRGGAGLVTLAVPRGLGPRITPAVPEATQLELPEPPATDAAERDYALAVRETLPLRISERFDVLAAGCGLGTTRASRILLEAVLERSDVPEVLDADALNLIASGTEVAKKEARVWTPHPGEFRRLHGPVSRGDAARCEAARAFVEQRGGVLLLKGHRTLVCDGSRAYINLTGNPGMATGGSGDVLTGLIAALMAQGFSPFDAASLGAYLHGLAGDLAARRLGEWSLAAGDIAESLPEAFLAYRDAQRSLRREAP